MVFVERAKLNSYYILLKNKSSDQFYLSIGKVNLSPLSTNIIKKIFIYLLINYNIFFNYHCYCNNLCRDTLLWCLLQMPIPWKKISMSVPVYMVIVAQWGGGWGLFTLMTQAPTYFSVILGLNIKMVRTTISHKFLPPIQLSSLCFSIFFLQPSGDFHYFLSPQFSLKHKIFFSFKNCLTTMLLCLEYWVYDQT